jgi:phage FluMu protein Com
MKDNKKDIIDDFDEANAAALAEMVADQQTSEPVRLQIINEILEASVNETFFEKMFAEDLSLAKCPHCKHENHWLIPEDDLNQIGWVTSDKDSRVPKHTSEDLCSEYAEACSKKKVTA